MYLHDVNHSDHPFNLPSFTFEQEVQKQREAKLAELLLLHIEPYLEGNEAKFRQWAKEERDRLKESCKSFFKCSLL